MTGGDVGRLDYKARESGDTWADVSRESKGYNVLNGVMKGEGKVHCGKGEELG